MDLAVAQKALKQYFGYDAFRPMQADIIQTVYAKNDALVLMPTGGGKSICFQIPAVTLPGMALVVSPLIALMKDQVEGLRANGVRAAFLNSSQTTAQQSAVTKAVYDGAVQILYVSPEKMLSPSFSTTLHHLSISLIAIDEAHCISAWGHDFRPEYTQLSFLKRQFADLPIIALTATADKLTRKDIIEQLGLQNPKVFIASFDRPNLSLEVRPANKRIEIIEQFIRERPFQSGIIYCLSRKTTEELAQKLNSRGIAAGYYHAQMSPRERSVAQTNFINDQTPIICATIAFGMGIDKSNVRWVIHYNLPKNMEGYYQEIGRAGRDGLPSDTLLFYSYGDVLSLRTFALESGQPDLQLAKLERMQQYAEAQICRRKILLNYFGENVERDCGNCDVCENPPKRFDGTVTAQKALSAVARLGESVGINMLVDVLRGSRQREVLEKGYDRIKTFGMGAEYTFDQWREYVHQLVQLGLLEIAYDQSYALKLTDASRAVLFKGQKVQLVKVEPAARQKEKLPAVKPKTKTEIYTEEILQLLYHWRLETAQALSIAPYLVLSDATLQAIAEKKPFYPAELGDISGISQEKMKLHGTSILHLIRQYAITKHTEGSNVRQGASNLLTLHYLTHESLPPEAIAEKRGIATDTVFAHIAILYEKGEPLKLARYITKEEVMQVLDAIRALGNDTESVKAIHTQLNEALPLYKVRLGVAYYNRHKG